MRWGRSLVVLFLAGGACQSFGAADDPAPEPMSEPVADDAGATDAARDATPDAALPPFSGLPALPSDCARLDALDTSFSGDATPQGWEPLAGENMTSNVERGVLSLSYDASETHHRGGLQRTLLPGDAKRPAKCFQLEVVYRYRDLTGAELLFAEVKFDNDALFALGIVPGGVADYAEQSLQEETSFRSLGQVANVPENVWHTAGLSFLERADGHLDVVATLDGEPIPTPEKPAQEFGSPNLLEIGVSFAKAEGSGAIEIDRVTLR